MIVFVITGAWRSSADVSVLLYALTRESKLYDNRFLQRSVSESYIHITGAWRSSADVSVLLYALTRESKLYDNRFLQRSVSESSSHNMSVSIDLMFLKEICDLLKAGLLTLNLQ